MTNHVHLIPTPETGQSLAGTLDRSSRTPNTFTASFPFTLEGRPGFHLAFLTGT